MTSGGKSAREESVQFSLQELLKLEDERLDEQTRAEKATAEAHARAKQEAEARKRHEEEAARTAAAETEERARRAEADAVAKREAMEKALVEQSRLEVDVKARAQERELERRHEIELARLRLDGKKGQLGPLVGAMLLGGAVMMLVAVGIHFGVTKPGEARRVAELELSLASAESRASEQTQQTERAKFTIDGLEKQLGAARAQIADLKQAAKPTSSAAPPAGGRPLIHVAPVTSPPAKPEPVCPIGDPMCPTISPRR